MSNEKTERKLKHHEKPIWRDAFKESMRHTSIEGATRNAWKAVDEWNRAGAFNESMALQPESEDDDCRLAIAHLRQWLEGRKKALSENQFTDFWKVMRDFDEAKIELDDFKYSIDQIGVID
jgi:hypothetical protein